MMKQLSKVETTKVHTHAIAQTPVKVCMHVLGQARTDVRVMREATALVEAGYVVSTIDVEDERSVPGEENIHGVNVEHIISPGWFVPTRFKPWFLVKFMVMTIRGIMRLIREPADVYHAQDQKALPACFVAALIRRKPLVYDAHELPLTEAAVQRWKRLHALATRFLVGVLPRCAGIITVSSPIAQEICTCYRVPEVALVRNIPAYQVVPRSDTLRQHLGVGAEVRIALYQGGIQACRGLDKLVRAAPFLGSNILIVMLGSTAGETQLQLEALIASEGVADRVKLLPSVPYEELLEWTASADIGLIIYPPDESLNVKMCLPNKLFEYLMAGLPVLASELDAVVDVIKSSDVGQVTYSLSPADVGAAITAMLADPIALADMRRHALEAARQEFCWEKEKQQLLLFYQNILGERNMTSSVRRR